MEKKELKEELKQAKINNVMQNVIIALLKKSLSNNRKEKHFQDTLVDEQVEHINQLNDEIFKLKKVLCNVNQLLNNI